MDSNDIGVSCYQLIRQNFSLERELNNEEDSFKQIHQLLLPEIKRLLDQDFNALLNILYRIDLQETQVTSILELAEPSEIASHLTTAIIERYKQKVTTRNRYKT